MKIIEKKSENDMIVLEVEGDIIINTISNCKNSFSPFVNKSKDITLSLSGVTKIDTSGFQLLMSIRREIIKKNRTFTIADSSAEIIKIFRLYGERV